MGWFCVQVYRGGGLRLGTTLMGKFSLGENFITPPTLGSLWTTWSSCALLMIFSGVQLGIFCGARPSFSFLHWCTCHNAQLPNMQWLGQKIKSIVP